MLIVFSSVLFVVLVIKVALPVLFHDENIFANVKENGLFCYKRDFGSPTAFPSRQHFLLSLRRQTQTPRVLELFSARLPSR